MHVSKLSALILVCLACGEKKDDAATGATAALDACAFMPRARVEALLGDLDGGSHSIAGSPPVLGTCRQKLAGGLQATLTVRSLTDFDAMAEGGTILAGLGEQAAQTQSGVVLKVAGQPHFFQVVVTGASGVEVEKTLELAKIVATTR